jgi:hypothetical protein
MKSFKTITQATLFSFLGFSLLTSAYAMEEGQEEKINSNPILKIDSFKMLNNLPEKSVFFLNIGGTLVHRSWRINSRKAEKEINEKNCAFLEAVKLQSPADSEFLKNAKVRGPFPTEEDLAQTLQDLTNKGIYFLPFTKATVQGADNYKKKLSTLGLQFLQENAKKLELEEGFTDQFKIVHGIMLSAQSHVDFDKAAKDTVSSLRPLPPVFGVIGDEKETLEQLTHLSLECPLSLYHYTAPAYFNTAEKVEQFYNEAKTKVGERKEGPRKEKSGRPEVATKDVFSKYQEEFNSIFK